MVGGKLPIRNSVLCFISPHYIRYRYRVKKQRLRKTTFPALRKISILQQYHSHLQRMESIGGLRKIFEKKNQPPATSGGYRVKKQRLRKTTFGTQKFFWSGANQPPSTNGEHRGDLEKFLKMKKSATVNEWRAQGGLRIIFGKKISHRQRMEYIRGLSNFLKKSKKSATVNEWRAQGGLRKIFEKKISRRQYVENIGLRKIFELVQWSAENFP